MANFEQLSDDFSRSRIPHDKRVSGFRVGLILIGMVITVPAFLAGAEIGQALGFADAVLVFLAAGLIVAGLAAITGYVGAENGLSTSMILQFSFGIRGAMAVNAVLALALLGWFGVTAQLFGSAMQQMMSAVGLDGPWEIFYLMIGIILMSATAIFGFKSLDKLSLLAVPAMLAFLAWTTRLSLAGDPLTLLAQRPQATLGIGMAISATAGGLMVAVTIMPDLCRYARSGWHAMFASFMGFLAGWPVIMLMAAVPGIIFGEQDLMTSILRLGIGTPGLVLLVLATWTTNASNIYSSSLFLAAISERTAKWKLVVAGAVIGTAIALSGAANHFIPFLLLLSIAIPPIAGIYVTDYLLTRQRRSAPGRGARRPPVNWAAFAAWAAGSGAGLAGTYADLSLSGIPALDSIAAAIGLYFVLGNLLTTRGHPAGIPD